MAAAGVSDGAIIIDTGIDNSGITKDSRVTEKLVNGLKNSVDKAGQAMAEGVNAYARAMERARNAAKALAGDQAAISKEIDKTESALARMEDRRDKMLAVSQRQLAAQREQLRQQMEEELKSSIGYNNWENMPEWSQMQALNDYMKDFEGRLAAIQGQPIENSKAWQSLQYDIEQTTAKLEGLRAELSGLEGTASTAGDVTEAMNSTVEVAGESLAKYARLMNEWSDTIRDDSWSDTAINDESAMLSITRYINEAVHERELAYSETLTRINETVDAMEAERAEAGAVASAEQEQAAATEQAAAASEAQVQADDENAASSDRLVSALLRVAGAARTAAGGLWGLVRRGISSGFHAIANAAKRAGKALAGLTKHQKQHNNSLGVGFKNILKYGLGIRSLYVLFNRLRAAVKEGFGELRKSAPEVDKALKNLKTSLTGLKGSLATAFAPILTAVEPALTTLIDLLTRAINAIGAFMAALSGASFYYVANSVSNVANGVEDVGNAASNASGDVKALKRQLAGFDELNILSQSSGGGGGGSGSGSGLTYIKTPIESGITDFVARLRSMWQDADFEGIGKIIADKINGVFTWAKSHVSWNIVGDKVTSVVRGITGAFNGLVDGIDGTLIGSTVAEVLNTITYTVDEFVSTINFGNAGKKLGEAITAMIYGVDWSGIGKTIANLFNGSLAFIRKAINEIDFGSAGANLATALKNFILKIDWNGLGGTIVNMTNGALAFVSKAIKEFDFGAVGRKLGGAIQTMIVGIDWNGLGETVGKMFNASIAFIRGAINNIDFKDAGTKLGAALNNLVFTVDWTGLGDTMKNLFNGVIAYIGGAINTFDFASFGTRLGKALSAFVVGIDWNGIGTSISNLFKGALAFLAHAIKEFNWANLGENLYNFLIHEIDWEGIGDEAARLFCAAFEGIGEFLVGIISGVIKDVFGVDLQEVINQIKKQSDEAYQERQKQIEESEREGMSYQGIEGALTFEDYDIEIEVFATLVKKWDDQNTKELFGGDFDSYVALYKKWQDQTAKGLFNGDFDSYTALYKTYKDQTAKGLFNGDFDSFVKLNKKDPNQTTAKTFGDNFAATATVNGKPGTGFTGKLSGTNKYTLSGIEDAPATINGKPGKGFQSKTTRAGNYKLPGIADSNTKVNMVKSWGKQTPQQYLGLTGLTAQIKAQLVIDQGKKSVSIKTGTVKGGQKFSLQYATQALGGIITAAGRVLHFASGGALRGAMNGAHGTMFLAGEAGPEIVGHIGGRTEVLNKSQLAQTMFAAVENGMLAAASRIEFHMPAMASGTVLPYDVSAQIAKTGQDIMTAMDANNEDLIQTIISVAGQIVNALGGLRAAPAIGGMTTQQVINALNQRTQMFGESPLQGV